jgi:hypothetical protein
VGAIVFLVYSLGKAFSADRDFLLCSREMYNNKLRLNSSNELLRDSYQTENKCCGWNGSNDYLNVNLTLEIPKSCCIKQTECDLSEPERAFLFKNSCAYVTLTLNIYWNYVLFITGSVLSMETVLSICILIYKTFVKKSFNEKIFF